MTALSPVLAIFVSISHWLLFFFSSTPRRPSTGRSMHLAWIYIPLCCRGGLDWPVTADAWDSVQLKTHWDWMLNEFALSRLFFFFVINSRWSLLWTLHYDGLMEMWFFSAISFLIARSWTNEPALCHNELALYEFRSTMEKCNFDAG